MDVGEKREMSHVSLWCMCGNDPGSMSNCGRASEGQRLWRGTNARENKPCHVLFITHTHTILHIPHIRGVYTTCNHLTRKVILSLNLFKLQSQM